MGPLAGIKVLDLTRLLPGPLCTHLLVRLGADVVKVESPEGDYARFIPPLIKYENNVQHGAFFEAVNAHKKNIVLDLKNERQRDALRRIALSYDILVEGNRPGVMDRLGLGYDELKKDNAGLIYCSLSGYGSTGPLAMRAGHDVNYMALAGLLGISGSEGDVPPLPGFQGADIAGALQGVIGIQAALLERYRTGLGQFVDISLCESAMVLGINALSQSIAGANQTRGTGHLDGGLCNYNIYTTADGKHMSVGALEPHFWKRLCEHVNARHLMNATKEQTAEFFRSKTYDEWVAIANECDACIEPILDIKELPSHPQHKARDVFLRHSDPDKQNLPPQVVLGPRMSNHPSTLLSRAAYPGEHNIDVLKAAGFSDNEIKTMFPLYKNIFYSLKRKTTAFMLTRFYNGKTATGF